MRLLVPALVVILASSGSVLAEEPKPAAPAAPAASAATTEHVDKIVSPDEAQKLIQEKKGIVILDVRTAEEFADGHIAGAQNLDYFAPDFKKKLAALDPSKSYLVHCAAGNRSGKAVDLMKQGNFVEIYHLKDGFRGWVKAGKPVEK